MIFLLEPLVIAVHLKEDFSLLLFMVCLVLIIEVLSFLSTQSVLLKLKKSLVGEERLTQARHLALSATAASVVSLISTIIPSPSISIAVIVASIVIILIASSSSSRPR